MTSKVIKAHPGPPWCVYLELSCGHTVLHRCRKCSIPKKVKCHECTKEAA